MKNQEKKKKKENPTPALRCPHTRHGRCGGGGRRGHGFHVPGHSHPVGGGLPHSAPSHHPAGRILTGKTGAGAEEGAGARVRRGPGERKQSWEHSACQPGHSAAPLGRGPASLGAWPLRPRHGGGGLGSRLCSCCPPRRERPSKNKTGSRPSLARQHKPKTPSGKG